MTTFTATERRAHALAAVSHGGSYTDMVLVSTVEVTTATTVGRTIDFGRIPSNARILGTSKLYWDAMATSTATLDLGLAAVDGNLANADDPNALHDAAAISAASAGGTNVIADPVNIGLPAWDFVASETSDPGGVLQVYGSLVDAAITTAGTVTLELHYVVD